MNIYSKVEEILHQEPDNYGSKLSEINSLVTSLDTPLEREKRHSIKRMINEYIARVHEEKYQDLLSQNLQANELDGRLDSYRGELESFIEKSNDVFDKNKEMSNSLVTYVIGSLNARTQTSATYAMAATALEGQNDKLLDEQREAIADATTNAERYIPKAQLPREEKKKATGWIKAIKEQISPKKSKGFLGSLIERWNPFPAW
jgi:uncharacterized membrane-anchored protein YhcB (DUF1043 family)